MQQKVNFHLRLKVSEVICSVLFVHSVDVLDDLKGQELKKKVKHPGCLRIPTAWTYASFESWRWNSHQAFLSTQLGTEDLGYLTLGGISEDQFLSLPMHGKARQSQTWRNTSSYHYRSICRNVHGSRIIQKYSRTPALTHTWTNSVLSTRSPVLVKIGCFYNDKLCQYPFNFRLSNVSFKFSPCSKRQLCFWASRRWLSTVLRPSQPSSQLQESSDTVKLQYCSLSKFSKENEWVRRKV